MKQNKKLSTKLMFSFEGFENKENNNGGSKYLSFGVHEVTINTEYVTGTDKNGNAYEAMAITFTDGNGATFTKRYFKNDDAEKAKKDMQRIFHLFSAITAVSELQKLKFDTFQSMVAGLAAFNGGKLRIKLVPAYKDIQYVDTPSYFSGWAESIDTVPSKIKLSTQEESQVAQAKELIAAKRKMESKKEEEAVIGSDDNLPF